MIRKYPVLLLIPAVLAMQMAFTQPAGRTISGTVFAEGIPLEGVLIVVKGTNRSSGTQADGVYYIPVTGSDSVLVFSHEEFQTQEIKLSATNEYNIELKKKGKPENGQAPFSGSKQWPERIYAATVRHNKCSIN